MQAVMIVQRYLKTACASMHATRLTVLFVAVEALIHGGRLGEKTGTFCISVSMWTWTRALSPSVSQGN